MLSSSYWKKRILDSEAYAQQVAATLSLKQQKVYIRSYNRIKIEILDIYSKVQEGEILSRSDLWRYGKNEQLKKLIEEQFGLIATTQETKMREALEAVYEHTLHTTLGGLSSGPVVFNDLEKIQMDSIITEAFQGSNYSSRIYANTDAIAQRVKNDLERLVAQGTSPDKLVKELQRDFNIGYSNANRLIRTEASRVFNKASRNAYENAGVKQMEYLAENDSCEECHTYNGNLYDIFAAPTLPVHPHCRCCYAPVIDEESTQ